MNNNSNRSSQNLQTCTVPQEVKDVWGNQCDSASLYMNKFPYIYPYPVTEKAQKTEVRKKTNYDLEKICDMIERAGKEIRNKIIPDIPNAVSFTAVNKGRLLIDHTGGILNGNLALHRFFNCPVIPGSAIKGIARNIGRFEADKERFARVFGGMEKGQHDNAGSVAFLMAVPANADWHIVADVLSSHQSNNPVPVFFPAVEAGATFRFTVAPTARTQEGDLKFAAECLKKALSENGVGAKTAAGYGWFEIEEKIELPPEEEVATYSFDRLEDRLDEIILSNNRAKQIAYINRMLSSKAKLLRRRRDKNDPYFEKFKSLVEKCGLELLV